MDPQDRFDEKDASDERARISEMKSDAIRLICEMPPTAFEAWYNATFVAMDEASTQAHNASEERRFQFAAATRGHEEPAW